MKRGRKSTTHKRVSKPMGFKIASSGDCQNSQFWCTSNFGTRFGGSLAPKRVSKPTVFKMAGSGTFKARNFGAPSILVPVWVLPRKVCDIQRTPNPPEFAQPHLSRDKKRLSPARGYKFGCVCSYMAGHEVAGEMTGHIGTNPPKFVPPRWGRPPCDPTQTGLCKFGCGFGAR